MPKCPYLHILRELLVKAISLACGGTTIIVFSTLQMGDATYLNFSKCNDVYEDILVLPNEIAKAINDLDGNKACGLDGIYAEHLKLGSRAIFVIVSLVILILVRINSDSKGITAQINAYMFLRR